MGRRECFGSENGREGEGQQSPRWVCRTIQEVVPIARRRLEKVSKNRGNFPNNDTQAQPALAQFRVQLFIAALGAFQELFHFRTPFFEALGVGMTWVGPMTEQALAEG